MIWRAATLIMLLSACTGGEGSHEKAASGETQITVSSDGMSCVIENEPVRCDDVDVHLRDTLRVPADRLVVVFVEGSEDQAFRRVMEIVRSAGYRNVLSVGFETEPSRVPAAPARASLTKESFTFIGAGTLMQQVRATVGEPSRDIGSGIHIYVYDLSDGSRIWIGSADGAGILYVRHEALASGESTSLYER